MQALKVSNHALGNRAELERLWAEDGYWFFRDVLDLAAIATLRAEYVAQLDKLGVIAGDRADPVWNGAPLDDYPVTFHELHASNAWPRFVRHPAINAFFESVFADELFWVPMDYYRALPPSIRPDPPRNLDVHQDGDDTPGVAFSTCWIPLNPIDVETGGLYLAAGQHRRGMLVRHGGAIALPDGPIDDSVWARADYRPGDVVIFCKTMPHYGDANRSRRFRLSLDIRAVRRSSPLPVIGTVLEIGPEGATVRSEEGGDVAVRFDDATIFRALIDPSASYPVRVTRENVGRALPPGTRVMATREDGRTLLFRAAMQ